MAKNISAKTVNLMIFFCLKEFGRLESIELVKCDINEERLVPPIRKKEPTYKRHHRLNTRSPDATAPFKIGPFEAQLEL